MLNDSHYLNGTFAHRWFCMCPTLMVMVPLRIYPAVLLSRLVGSMLNGASMMGSTPLPPSA